MAQCNYGDKNAHKALLCSVLASIPTETLQNDVTPVYVCNPCHNNTSKAESVLVPSLNGRPICTFSPKALMYGLFVHTPTGAQLSRLFQSILKLSLVKLLATIQLFCTTSKNIQDASATSDLVQIIRVPRCTIALPQQLTANGKSKLVTTHRREILA